MGPGDRQRLVGRLPPVGLGGEYGRQVRDEAAHPIPAARQSTMRRCSAAPCATSRWPLTWTTWSVAAKKSAAASATLPRLPEIPLAGIRGSHELDHLA